jgi:hypothetical protein
MFDIEVALLNQRLDDISRNYSNANLTELKILNRYFQTTLYEIREELTKLKDDLSHTDLINVTSSINRSRYFQSILIRISDIRMLMSAVDRDLPIAKIVHNQSASHEYVRLERMVKESLKDCNPSWTLCIWDEFKCLLPRTPLDDSIPAFTFVVYPESAIQSALVYPILFHEIGHSALLTSQKGASFENLGMAIDEMNDGYITRISSAGGSCKKHLMKEWTMKGCWEMWGRELFCDGYALLTAGPAYSYAMIAYLSGTHPFDAEAISTHPPMQMRLDFMELMLEQMSIDDGCFKGNRVRWEEFKKKCSFQVTTRYRLVNDRKLNDALLSDFHIMAKNIGIDKNNYWTLCDRDSTAVGMINNAWEKVLNEEIGVTEANEYAFSQFGQY